MASKKSKKDEFLDELESDEKELDDVLEKTQKIQDNVPLIQQRKDEISTVKDAINKIPDDDFVEFFGGVQKYYSDNSEFFKEKYKDNLTLPNVLNLQTATTSGTASVTTSIIQEINTLLPSEEKPWVSEVGIVISLFAEKRSKEQTIPILLEKIREGLGREFSTSVQAYEKSKSGNEDLQDTMNKLRTFNQSFWGNIVEAARTNCEKLNQRFELKKESHRKIIAECLARENSTSLELQLLNFSKTYSEMSSPAKNLNFDDISKVSDLYNAWLLQIDAILSLMKI